MMDQTKLDEMKTEQAATPQEKTKTKNKRKNKNRYNKTKRKRNKWSYALIIFSLLYIGWRFFFTLPFGYGLLSLVVGLALFISELIAVVESLLMQNSYGESVLPDLPVIPDVLYPDVDIFIATHSEEPTLLYKTVNGCKFLNYPDKDKVHIFICDDGNRAEMAALAKEMEIGYIPFPKPKHAKAGNLNNALEQTTSPLVVTLDSDMIPKSDFLMKTVPYFFLPKVIKEDDDTYRMRTEDEIDPTEKIGFIQTPQTFYNPDMFQYNLFVEREIPNEQDFFFREVNVGRNASNSPIYAGSNTVISREALEEIGGIRMGTITEDFATGMDIQTKGYRCFAISEALVSGMAPTTFESLVKQRIRWGRGCVQSLLRFSFFFGKMSFAAKTQYFACLLYWSAFFRRTIYILCPILYAVFGVIVVDMVLWQFLLIGLPCYLIYNKSLNVLSNQKIDFRWSNTVDTILAPFLVFPILLESFGIRMKKFVVTEKTTSSDKNSDLSNAVPNILFLCASIVGIVFSVHGLIYGRAYGNIIILWWLILNSYFLVMAITFTTGRSNYRTSERFTAQLPITVYDKEEKIEGTTSDISEGGLSLSLDYPFVFDYNEILSLELEDRQYHVEMTAKIVHVNYTEGENCRYSLQIESIDEENKAQYFGLLFDREPCFSTKIKTKGLGDLFKFATRKNKKAIPSYRKLPRVSVEKQYTDSKGISFEMQDFNGQFFTAKMEQAADLLQFVLIENISVTAHKVRVLTQGAILYEIDDWKNYIATLNENAFFEKESQVETKKMERV